MKTDHRIFFIFVALFAVLLPLHAQTGKVHYSIIDGDFDLRRINMDGTADESVYLPPVTEPTM